MARPSQPSRASTSQSLGVTQGHSTPFGEVRRAPGTAAYEKGSWCGPFSIARELINKREQDKSVREAKAQRRAERKRRRQEEFGRDVDDIDASDSDSDGSSSSLGAAPHPLDNLMGEARAAKRRAMHPSLSWMGKKRAMNAENVVENKNESFYDMRKRHKASTTSAVPSLSSICVGFLVANFECIESLGGVDSQARNQISKSLVDKNVLDDSAVAVLAGANLMDEYYGTGGVTSLEIPDASKVRKWHTS